MTEALERMESHRHVVEGVLVALGSTQAALKAPLYSGCVPWVKLFTVEATQFLAACRVRQKMAAREKTPKAPKKPPGYP